MLTVTKTFLPPFEEYEKLLRNTWERGWITNNGPLCRELEERLQERLNVKHVILVNNGTIAIQIAIRALGISREVITTPFSYVATTSSIHWEGAKAVFADIDAETLCIDPAEIESRITDQTSAIIPTHVFGRPCDVEALDAIARKHGLRQLYDAAHAFDVRLDGDSVLKWGDCSTLSFHATKLFHSVEGGAIVCEDDEIAHICRYMRNFGHKGKEDFSGIGVNGKISEVHCAMGLCMLDHVDEIIASRKEATAQYNKRLSGSDVSIQVFPEQVDYNYAYYPAILPSEQILLKARKNLLHSGVEPRRYFYPSLNSLPYVEQTPCPVSEDISSRILCLPLYYDMAVDDIDLVSSTLLNSLA